MVTQPESPADPLENREVVGPRDSVRVGATALLIGGRGAANQDAVNSKRRLRVLVRMRGRWSLAFSAAIAVDINTENA